MHSVEAKAKYADQVFQRMDGRVKEILEKECSLDEKAMSILQYIASEKLTDKEETLMHSLCAVSIELIFKIVELSAGGMSDILVRYTNYLGFYRSA